METNYDPQSFEKEQYERWESAGYFKPSGDTSKESYCIMIPPPNVTGHLHMGHAFQDTIMDTLTRYHRMKGHNTLWQMGTDHAGIATQMVVERKIAQEENKTKHDYGREAFIEKVWDWKAHSGGTICKQLRRLGASVDWDRERFTMDEGLSHAVKEVFVRLYNDDLIYRGKRLVNWDPKLHTAISDLEVENVQKKGFMWHFRYPLADGVTTADGKNYIVVATTRPETMMGDTGVAVNPEDPRYKDLIGKHVMLPIVNRRIPIIGDEHADMEKGTGCVKITPAHDFNDYEVGKRHQLPMINILTFNAEIRASAEVVNTDGETSDVYDPAIPERYHGLDRFKARKEVVAEFETLGLLECIEDHELSLPYGDRGGVVIEPMLTDQWYVRSEPLAGPAIEAVESGRIRFVSKQYENMYLSWMRNIQDWCISRQLWWGHRIPAWYDADGKFYVGRSEEEVRKEHNINASVVLTQDEDVLDTWFSSALWTFSTLGWPDDTEALKTFHPTNVLVTGFDIIPFWVARMIMMTLYFIKNEDGTSQVPFKEVYVTGLIRDESGEKMSKSKGNVLDPLDMCDGIGLDDLVTKRTSNLMQPKLVEKITKNTKKAFPEGINAYGTDALRFTLAALASNSRNINWDMRRLEGYRNFCNKLWNASRYVLMNVQDKDCGFGDEPLELSLADRWIQSQFHTALANFDEQIKTYRFDLAATTLFEFIWNQFCDWYIELTKPALYSGTESEQRAARHVLITTLEATLRLAHPMIPFITETIWQSVKPLIPHVEGDTIMTQAIPEYDASKIDAKVVEDQEWIKTFISGVRNLRAEYNIPPGKRLDVMLKINNEADRVRFEENTNVLLSLAKLGSIEPIATDADTVPCAMALVNQSELLIPMESLIDKEQELARLAKKAAKLEKEIQKIEGKLNNEKFMGNAPPEIVEKERARLNSEKEALARLEEQRQQIANL